MTVMAMRQLTEIAARRMLLALGRRFEPVDECETAMVDKEPTPERARALGPSGISVSAPSSADPVRDLVEAFAEWTLQHSDDCDLREEIRTHARLAVLAAGRRAPKGDEWAFWWEELTHRVARRRELAETGVPRLWERGIGWDARIAEALTKLCGGAR